MKSSNIGGQAVMEGVMMKNKEKYAVAVRKPDGKIEIMTGESKSIIKYEKLTKTPFVRGIFNFIDSMVLGMKTLSYSADFFLEEEDDKSKGKKTSITDSSEKATQDHKSSGSAKDKKADKEKKSNDGLLAGTMIIAVLFALGMFIGIPFAAGEALRRWVTEKELIVVTCEGILRLLLFFGYVVLISQMNEIKRVYMYHGAEHKCINCIENGWVLNVENVRKSSKEHKRCGTSFLLFVMIISIVIGLMIRVSNPWLRLLVRFLMIPVVAGIAYELIKWAGNSDNPVVCVISKPGLWLQKLTTKEPDDSMIEVGIQSVEAVFDWKAYFKENGILVKEKASVEDEVSLENKEGEQS